MVDTDDDDVIDVTSSNLLELAYPPQNYYFNPSGDYADRLSEYLEQQKGTQ